MIEGEKTGRPCLIALAITEPSAGTDVEEVDLVDKGKVTCQARKVKGGYIVGERHRGVHLHGACIDLDRTLSPMKTSRTLRRLP